MAEAVFPRHPHPVAIAALGGLAAGGLELAGYAIRHVFLGEFLFQGPHLIWAAPAANLLVYLMLGLGLTLGAMVLPRLFTTGVITGSVAGLAMFGLLYIFPQLHRVASLILALGVGVQAGRWAAGHPDALGRGVRRLLPAGLGLVLLLAAATGAWRMYREHRALRAIGEATPGTPNVLLLVLDTVRAFNLGMYGYPRPTSPNLDAFAATGARFEQAFSTAPWTLPSHASLFTGHQAHESRADWMVPLEDTVATVAEVLSRYGFVTAGFSANTDYASEEVGLARGFTRFEDYTLSPARLLRHSQLALAVARNRTLRRLLGAYDNLGRKHAPEVTARILGWLDDRPAEKPFFIFANYYDAHRPYLPPAPWNRKFAADGGSIDPRLDRTGRPGDAARAERTQGAIDAYDGAIAYLDDELGRLFAELGRRKLLTNTLVIITSDHGEEFGEHGIFDHGNSLYRQSLQVPLVIRLDNRIPPGSVVDEAVSLRDIPATITDLTGLGSGILFPGQSLAERVFDPTRPADTIFATVRKAIRQPASYPAAQGDLSSVAIDSLRLIRNLGTGREELFDFLRDPREASDLRPSPRGDTAAARLGALLPSPPSHQATP
ncbi:MAG: sulfatase [Gemmatimonadetes bacterium]|nr:sulfatase [Gemmatimonadota bacterium]